MNAALKTGDSFKFLHSDWIKKQLPSKKNYINTFSDKLTVSKLNSQKSAVKQVLFNKVIQGL